MNSNGYERMLTAKAEELRIARISKDQIEIERNAELLDEIQRTADREIALDALTRNWRTSSLVASALSRIACGEFGICTECEEPISERRLDAIPWAQCCLTCQEQKDRNLPETYEWAQAA